MVYLDECGFLVAFVAGVQAAIAEVLACQHFAVAYIPLVHVVAVVIVGKL